MGYTIPGWLDEVLDFIGINFPNVDEDDYREMADAMREFADKFEGHGADAHNAVSRILSSSEGWAVDAFESHWSQVKASHLEKLPELARLFADACDVLADIIFGMKTKAEAELAVMAGSVGLSIGLAWVTGGLSAVLGAAEITAMRQAVKRIIDEAVDRIVDEVIAKVTEPVNAKLESMVEDMVLDLVEGGFSMPADGGHSQGKGGHGHAGMQLASAGGDSGGGSGPQKRLHIDHDEFEAGAGRVSRHGSQLHLASSNPLGRARSAFGRSKGRDPFTRAFDSVLHGAIKGSEKALKKIAHHITTTLPDRARATSRLHKGRDHDVRSKIDAITGGKKNGDGTGGHGRPRVDGGRTKNPRLKIDSARVSQRARAFKDKFTCNDPIDMASGQMILGQTDVDLPGILPLALRRTHLSGYTHGISFGPSWASTLDERLEADPDTGEDGVWWHREDGSSLYYPRTPDIVGDRVDSAAGERLPLTYLSRDASYALVIQDPFTGLTRHFEAARTREGTWWLTRIEDRNHNHITLERTPDDRLSELTHSGGYRLQFTTAPHGALITDLHLVTDDAPVRLRGFEYDTSANLTTVRSAVGAPTRFAYDDDHRITGWRDSNDTELAYTYDAYGRVVATTGSDGILNSRLDYAGPHEDGSTTVTYTDSLGHTTAFRANAHGQIVAITDPIGHTITQTWDSRDHLLSRTDALGRTTRWDWNDEGDLITVTAADGAVSHTEYNAFHLPIRWTGPDGSRIEQEYDMRGNRTAVIGPDGATHHFTHHESGAPATVTDPLGSVLTIEADASGLPIALVDAHHSRTVCRRDAFGRVTALTDALGATTRTRWDAEGRICEQTAADGTRARWEWDGEGNCLSHTDQIGGVTRYTYGPFNLLRTYTLPDGATYTLTHDTERRLTHVSDPSGHSWTFAYSAHGDLISETDYDGRTITSDYDGAGQLTTRHTPAGHTWTFAYDQVGRCIERTVDGQSTTYTYDAAGRLHQARTTASHLTLAYDAAGRVTAETVDGRTMHYRYDALGQRTGRTTPSGVVSEEHWDATGNRTLLRTGTGHALHFSHDAMGREIQRALSEQVSLASQWDQLGHLSGHTLLAGGQALRERRFTYRADGALSGISDLTTGRATGYERDHLGRPLNIRTGQRETETYRYDPSGNQASARWTGPKPSLQAVGERVVDGTKLLSAAHTSYLYDEAGRVVERRKKRLSHKPDIWRYTWDAEDRLTSCTTPDGTTWHYSYDPLGRRTAKHRLEANGSVAEEVLFAWDGTRLAEQMHTGTSISTTWDYDGYRPLAQYERRPSTQNEFDTRFFAIVTDLVGTPTELVDEDGHIAWHTRTTAWGITAWNADATAYTPLRFPGQYADPETGLHYNYFRHYDPETARYATPDPLGLAPAPNPVTYVPDPQTQSDPLGLLPCDEKDITWGGRVHYRELGPGGRAQGVTATLTRSMTGGKTNPQVDPAGWESDKGYNRAHLLGAQIGGSNKDPRNFVTMHRYANSPIMRRYESQVRKAVDKGEVIEYSATPVYRGDSVIPEGVWLEAHGSDGFQFMPKGATTGTNRVYIPNEPKN